MMRLKALSEVGSIICAALVLAVAGAAAAAVPTPESVLGFTPGSDRQLMDYGQLVGYLERLAAASGRVELRTVGSSPMGRRMHVVFISSEDNIGRLDELREINRRLAVDPEIPDGERTALIDSARVFVMETLSMHSGEVAPSQSLPLHAYELATTEDPEVLRQLADVVLMIIPCHNPDGMDMVVEHYRSYRGTPYEGSSMPGVYHKYVGHDNNRDFVALTQADTRVISDLYSTQWYPQVLVEKHQMGSTGPRYYVPPNHDPIAQVIDEGLWNWSAVFGASLARDMTADGHRGVASHWMFDDYWPGSTETSHWKNVISFLTEAASCKTATPIFVEPSELAVRGKGLAEYKKGVNMLDPWPGGWWTLGDIVDYELSSMRSILATASRHRSEILAFRNELCRKEVEKGRTEAPRYFVLPLDQRDPAELANLVDLLRRHGVEVRRLAEGLDVGGHQLYAGDVVVPLAQPYRPFVIEMLQPQRYPERHYTFGGELIKPYDITSWSLPLHMGVRCLQLDARSTELEARLEALPEGGLRSPAPLPAGAWAVVYPPTSNAAYRAAFAALQSGLEVARTTSAVAVGSRDVEAGSFVLRGGAAGREALASLVASTSLEALVLDQQAELPLLRLRLPRIGLVETYFHDMDAGWTRYLFDSYDIPYRVLRPADLDTFDIARELDVIVFPDQSEGVLTKGKYKRGDRYVTNDYPPEFRKPISEQGMSAVTRFITGGGTVVSWGGSTALFTGSLAAPEAADGSAEAVELPVRDISEDLDQVLVPGAFLAVDFRTGHPLTWGMPERGGAFSRGEPVFATSIPILDTDRRVLGLYPERELLLSGYLEGEEQLQNRAVVVWVRAGRGQLALFGIRPQFRGSTPATYKLVFNALLLPKVE